MRQKPGTKQSHGEKVVKDIRRAKRKQYSAEEKIRIVLDGLKGEDSIADLLRIAAHASSLVVPVIPHGSGPYSCHFIASQTAPPLCDYVASSADGQTILPVFGMALRDRAVLQGLPG